MNRLSIVIDNISLVLDCYDKIKMYRADSEEGSYVEITDVDTRIDIIPEQTVYFYRDDDGSSTHWYKTSYFNSVTFAESELSSARLGGTEAEKIGYTFNNYSPPSGEWGKVYTADDMRYTRLFGIDCIGSDVAQSEFTDEQFDQLILEALGDFEDYLTIDIRKRVYKTFHAIDRGVLIRGRLWREGVDFTHEDEPYDFDPQQWSEFGFIQLRHYPVLSLERAVWYSPVKGEIMDMKEVDWLRVYKQFGQIRMFPKGGFTYGPYSVYGPLWTGMGAKRYPGAFEFDYSTGFESSDGLSESFSSTQSATSAYFGARIKQYSDEIKDWLTRNRYKFAPIPMSFVGAT